MKAVHKQKCFFLESTELQVRPAQCKPMAILLRPLLSPCPQLLTMQQFSQGVGQLRKPTASLPLQARLIRYGALSAKEVMPLAREHKGLSSASLRLRSRWVKEETSRLARISRGVLGGEATLHRHPRLTRDPAHASQMPEWTHPPPAPHPLLAPTHTKMRGGLAESKSWAERTIA